MSSGAGGAGRGGRRPTIGVLLPWLGGDPYSREVLAGIVDAVRAREGNVIGFTRDTSESPIYDLVTEANVDGLIILGGAVLLEFGIERLSEYCERWAGIPMASVAQKLPNIPTIRVDNRTGIRDAVAHLVNVHHRERIAFIRWPEENADATERYNAYLEALEDHGLRVDPALIAQGQLPQGGADSIAELFDARRANPDAIVAVDDSVALGVVQALRERGIDIPNRVSVVGFDDVAEARLQLPPLTTVRQSLRGQGEKAAETVFAQLAGERVPSDIVLETHLVVRRSCGCFPRSVMHARLRSTGFRSSPPASSQARPPSENDRRGALVSDLRRIARWPDVLVPQALIDAFLADVLDERSDSFLSVLDAELARAARPGVDVFMWQELLASLRRALPWLLPPSANRMVADELLQQGSVLIGDTAIRAEGLKRLSAERRALTLSRIGHSLIGTTNLQQLVDVLRDALPLLGIERCYVFLYEDPLSPCAFARLMLRFDARGCAGWDEGIRFPSTGLLPEGTIADAQPYAMLAIPLASQREPIGVVLLDVDPTEAFVYEELRKQFGAAFKRMEGEQNLARLNAIERERARELKAAYDALRENQERLVISEKMASLGRLTAGMAHEMNTPLAAVRAALAEVHKLVAEYASSVGDPSVSNQDHVEIARDMHAAVALATSPPSEWRVLCEASSSRRAIFRRRKLDGSIWLP